MLVFNLLEILFSGCYWDGQLPGSSGPVTGDSAPRTTGRREAWAEGWPVRVQGSMPFPRAYFGSGVALPWPGL